MSALFHTHLCGRVAVERLINMKDNNQCSLHLLDYLSREAGCVYLSDLHHPQGKMLSKLTESVASLPAQAASLQEWNAALKYIGNAPLELTAERAKDSLLAYLVSRSS